MQGNGASLYAVGVLAKAKQQIHDLVAKAAVLGYGTAVAATLTEIATLLQTAPLHWGEPQFHTVFPGGVVRHGARGGLSVNFVVYQIQRMVVLLDVVPMGDHPQSKS